MEKVFTIGDFFNNTSLKLPQLHSPSQFYISSYEGISYIVFDTNVESNGRFASRYKLYNDISSELVLIKSDFIVGSGENKLKLFDIIENPGTYNLQISLSNENNFIDSRLSEILPVTIHSIQYSLKNIAVQSINDERNIYRVLDSNSITVNLSAENNLYLPEKLNITEHINGEDIPKSYTYDSYTGKLTISNIKGNIQINGEAYIEPKLQLPEIEFSQNKDKILVNLDSHATQIDVYIDEAQLAKKIYYVDSVSTFEFPLSDLGLNYSASNYDITIKLLADNYQSSDFSNSLTYTNLPRIWLETADEITVSNILPGSKSLIIIANDQQQTDPITITENETEKKISVSSLTNISASGTYTIKCTVTMSDESAFTSRPETVYLDKDGTVKIYGVSGEGLKSSDGTSLTRILDSVGLNYIIDSSSEYAVTSSDFDSCYPWSDISDYTDPETQNVFVKIPKYYTCYDIDTDGSKVTKICKYKLNSNYLLNPAFISSDGSELDFILVGKYQSSIESNSGVTKLVSKSGLAVDSFQSSDSMRTLCKVNGENYHLMDMFVLKAIQDLCMVEFARTFFDNSFIPGNTSIYQGLANSGYSDQIAYKTGWSTTSGQACMKYRGIENLWGNGNTCIDGIKLYWAPESGSVAGNKLYLIKYCDNYLNYGDYTKYKNFTVTKDIYVTSSYQLSSILYIGDNKFIQYLYYDSNINKNLYGGYSSYNSSVEYSGIYTMDNCLFGYFIAEDNKLNTAISKRFVGRIVKK